MQRIRSKHRYRPELCINELREAALSTCVSEKNREDEAKDRLPLNIVEVEDNIYSVIHETACKSL